MIGGLSPVGAVFGLFGLASGVLAVRRLVGLVGRIAALVGQGSRRIATGRVQGDASREGPVSGEPCVGYLIVREAYVTIRAGVPYRVWRAHGVETTLDSFQIQTDTGTVTVRPARGDQFGRVATDAPEGLFGQHRLTRDAVTDAYDGGERPAQPIGDAFSAPVPDDSSHRYVEYRIEPGDRVSVVGAPDGGAAADSESVTDDGGFALVDGGSWRLLITPALTTVAYGSFGLLASVVPLAQLLV